MKEPNDGTHLYLDALEAAQARRHRWKAARLRVRELEQDVRALPGGTNVHEIAAARGLLEAARRDYDHARLDLDAAARDQGSWPGETLERVRSAVKSDGLTLRELYDRETLDLFKAIRHAGLKIVRVADEGGGWERYQNDSQALNVVNACDVGFVRVKGEDGGSTLTLVYGNSPGELVSDYTYSSEGFYEELTRVLQDEAERQEIRGRGEAFWVDCHNRCGNKLCLIHGEHAHECACPPVGEVE